MARIEMPGTATSTVSASCSQIDDSHLMESRLSIPIRALGDRSSRRSSSEVDFSTEKVAARDCEQEQIYSDGKTSPRLMHTSDPVLLTGNAKKAE